MLRPTSYVARCTLPGANRLRCVAPFTCVAQIFPHTDVFRIVKDEIASLNSQLDDLFRAARDVEEARLPPSHSRAACLLRPACLPLRLLFAVSN